MFMLIKKKVSLILFSIWKIYPAAGKLLIQVSPDQYILNTKNDLEHFGAKSLMTTLRGTVI